MGSQSRAGGATMRFGVLGSLRITVDGREVALDSPKQRSLLGALLIEAGSVVSTARLAEILWGDDQPADPAGAVQTHVSRLRRLLGDRGGGRDGDLIETRPPGYALAVEARRIDAGRFERLVADARAAASPEMTADLVAEALALWRGRPLAEFDHDRARAEATRLEELRIGARELWADALLASGRHAEVVGELEAAVARHPLREQLCGRLMVALDRCGRRADALAVYRELRDALVGELGVEPSVALRRLERAILQRDEELPWPAPAGGGAPGGPFPDGGRTAGAASDGLPEELTSFVGRGAELRGVAAALADNRVVVLTGVGGVGKSRLAVRVAREVADDHPDGVWLADLVAADDPEAVANVVATALGVVPARRAGPEEALVESLRAQRLLLVLDNCDHVLAGASALVDRIGRTCPGVDVLATSRQPLDVAGQQLWPVEPLSVGDRGDGAAVALFDDRAAAVEPSFRPGDADREAIGEICRRLDGLPLAVELAAARVRSMTPADIADRLDRRFELLRADPRMASSRHRSLQEVVDWSYALLPEATRRLFERLAVFSGGFGLDTAEQVCAGDGVTTGEVAGRLAGLVDHSLVTVDRSGRRARYRLLETLRTYGRDRLEDRGELPAWRRRHAEHFAALAARAAAGLEGSDEADWVRTVDAELANLRAAHGWALAAGRVDLALRLPALLRVYAYYRLRDEVYDWALRALELPDAPGSPAWPAALVAAGVGCMQRGDLPRANDHAERALAAGPDEPVRLRARQLLTEIALYRGHLEETDRRGRDLTARAGVVDNAYYGSLGHLYRGFAAVYDGRAGDATAHLGNGWPVVEAAGTPSLRAGFRYLEGEIRLDDHPGAARVAFDGAIRIARSVGNRFIEGVAKVSAASLEARHGRPDEALEAFREIVDHWRRSGDRAHMWTTLRNLLVLLDRVGASEAAAVLLGAVETATTGAAAFGADADRLRQTADSLRGSLGGAALADARARGRAMVDEEAVTYALDAIDRLVSGQSARVP